MATSGVLYTSEYKGSNGTRYLELSWVRESINVAEQTSTIKWTLTSRGTYTGYYMSGSFNVVINGTICYDVAARIKLYPNQEIATGRLTIKHNTDGTKSFSASASAAVYYQDTNIRGSGNYTLDLVGMATITKAYNFYDTSNPTIEYYNPVGNAITSLQAAISLTGANPDIAYRNVAINGTSYTFNLTEAERNILRAATQGSHTRKVFFYLRNVINGNIHFHYKEVYFTVMDGYPTIEASVVDVNDATTALTGDITTLIRHHSKASASMSATAYKEATITNVSIENNGNLTTEYVALYNNVNSNVFNFVATDSRNNKTTKTIIAPMIDYVKPTANIENNGQMNTDGSYNLRCSGNYYNDTFGYTDAAAANTIEVMFRYKIQGGTYGSWLGMNVELNGNTYNAYMDLTGLDYRNTYVFQCQITDKLNTALSAELTVKSLPVFHWSESDFVFEVPVIFNAGTTGGGGGSSSSGGECAIQDGKLDGSLHITGDLRLKGSGNYGNSLKFGDGDYCYLKETADDMLTINARQVDITGSLKVNGVDIAYTESGIWTPTLTTAAAVSSYTSRSGWYQRAGDVITIGWNIKAVIKSGYNSTAIGISGAPYTPDIAAFGGGVAHNIYLTAGYCFEGWGISEDGIITPRGQPCNNTAAGNLQINSTAYYPTGTNTVLTLAGTISYKIAAGVG